MTRSWCAAYASVAMQARWQPVWLRNNQMLSAALTGITAAVVGVIANLAVFFSFHNLFDASRRLRWGPVHLDLPILASWGPVAIRDGKTMPASHIAFVGHPRLDL